MSLNTFSDDDHKYLADLIRSRRARNPEVQSLLEDPGTPVDTWVHVVATVAAATPYGRSLEDYPVRKPLTIPPAHPKGEGAETVRIDDVGTPGEGLVELYHYEPRSRTLVRSSTARHPIYNLAYHPVPIGWFRIATLVEGRLWFPETNQGWLLFTPSAGVPAVSDDYAGVAECEIWETDWKGKRIPVMEGEQKITTNALNWSASEVSGSTFVQAKTINKWVTIDVEHC